MPQAVTDQRRDSLFNACGSTRRAWLPILLVLLFGLIIAGWADRLPSVRDAASPETVFSADRAMVHIEAIAVRPHPIGSVAIDATRGYIVEQARALGLETHIIRGTGLTDLPRLPFVAAGYVQDIAATLPGTDRTLPAIVLMAHYDTVPLSAGSGDDTAAVAALLETARALKAGKSLKRDVVFLFTEGEEVGLLGSSMFFANLPRDRVGTVLNFEARGTGGRALMFQVSPASGNLVRLYAAAVSLPSADSFVPSLYKYMPNDTDLTSSLGHGFAGLNFAFADRQVGYHTPMATPPFLERGSLQHMGDQSLAMTKALAGRAVLPEPSADLAYADIYGTVLVYYPAIFGWLLVAIAAGALVFGAVAMRRRKELSRSHIARGIALAFALLFSAALWIDAGFHLVGWLASHVGSEDAVAGNFSWFLAGSIALATAAAATLFILASRSIRPLWPCLGTVAIGVVSSALAGMAIPSLILGVLAATALALFLWRRRVSPFEGLNKSQWLGLIATLLLFAIVLQMLIPTGSPLFVWPTLAAALLLAVVGGGFFRPRVETATVIIIAALVFAHIATRAHDNFVLVGSMLPQMLAIYVLLSSALLFALIRAWAAHRHAFGHAAALTALGLVCCVIAGATRPTVGTLTEAFEVADLATGHAWRASYLTALDPWARETLSRGGRAISRRSFPPFLPTDLWVAPAPTPALLHPLIVPQPADANGHLTLLFMPRNGGRSLQIALKPTVPLSGISVQGVKAQRAFPANTWSQVAFSGVPPEGVRLTFVAGAAGAVEVETLETVGGWPTGELPPPPPGALPFRLSNSTLVLDAGRYAWNAGQWGSAAAKQTIR